MPNRGHKIRIPPPEKKTLSYFFKRSLLPISQGKLVAGSHGQ